MARIPDATGQTPADQTRNSYQQALQAIARDIAERLELPQLMDSILEKACRVIDADVGIVSLEADGGQEIEVYAVMGMDSLRVGTRSMDDEGVTARVWKTGEALVVNHYAQWEHRISQPYGAELAHIAAVPMRVGNRLVGVLEIARREVEREFDETTRRLLGDFAELAAIAVDNARLRDEVKLELRERQARELDLDRRLRETDLLRQVSSAASASLEPLTVLTAMCRELAGALGVPQAAFARLADDGSHIVVVAEHRPPGITGLGLVISLTGNAITEHAITSRQPIAVFDAQHDPRMGDGTRTAASLGIASMLIVPIVAGGTVIGTLGLDSLEPREFTSEDIRLAQTVASTAAPALEHARLFESLEGELLERRRIEQALRTSEARHRALIDAMPDAIYRLDTDGRIIDARTPGRNTEWSIGKLLSDVLPAPLAGRAFEAAKDARANQSVQVLDEALSERHIELRLAPVSHDSVVMIERDITERKRVERALMESRERYEELVNSLEGIVWEAEVRRGGIRMVFLSRQIERLLGGNVQHWLEADQGWSTVHPEDREHFQAKAAQAIASRSVFDIEHRTIDAEGRTLWFHNHANIALNGDRVVGLRGLATEITARKQVQLLEQDRNRVLELAARGGKLEVVLGLITAMMVRQYPDAGCGIVQFERGELRLRAGTGLSANLTAYLERVQPGSSGGPIGVSGVGGETLEIHDLLRDDHWPERWRASILDEGFRSVSTTPIRSSLGAVVGVLTMFGRRPGLGSVAHDQMLAAADLASIAIEKHLLNERLEFQALHDALTGLPNRTLFADRLDQAISHARRNRNTTALVFVDLDGFKPVNDTHGHSVGDALLREVATRLVACTRTTDTVARLGGDEFCVILTDLEDASQAVPIAREIVRAISAGARLGEREVFISASVGVTAFPHHGDDAETLYRLADQAMYRAKSAGGHRVAIHGEANLLEITTRPE